MSDPTATPDGLRAGWKTTEFWTTLLAQVLGAVTAIGIISPASPVAVVAGLVLAGVPTIVYAWRRSHLKAVYELGKLGWNTYQALVAAGHAPELARIRVSPSLAPPSVFVDTASGKRQVADPENPR